MKYMLNISFNQKYQVKAEAVANNTRIQWDAASKSWYWEGDTLPSFLIAYTSQANQVDQTIYYLCRANTAGWYTVDYAFNSKELATAKMLELANNASTWEDAIIASSYTLITSAKKISVNKNISSRWISRLAHFSDAKSPELKAAYARLRTFLSEQ